MNEEQMQAAVDQLIIDMMGKGLRKPEAMVWVQSNKSPCICLSSGDYGRDSWSAYPSAPTVADALDSARSIIAKMPDAKTRQMQTFMAALGKVIDLGRDNSIDVDFLNPLTATMKALSENIITDQREAKE